VFGHAVWRALGGVGRTRNLRPFDVPGLGPAGMSQTSAPRRGATSRCCPSSTWMSGGSSLFSIRWAADPGAVRRVRRNGLIVVALSVNVF